MDRVRQCFGFKSLLFLFIFLFAAVDSALATTAIVPSDDTLIVEARAIVRGKVTWVESALDSNNRIFTYVTLKVQEVLKGQISERKIVIKEPGGEVGTRGTLVYGTPRFVRGDRVLVYLDTWDDGSLRVHQMFLGRFAVIQDPQSGRLIVTRNVPELGVSVIGESNNGPITNKADLAKYTEMVRTRLTANWGRAREFESEVYGRIPLLSRPVEYKPSNDGNDVSPQFHLWNPPIRWFQPDNGQPVVFKTNPDGAPTPQSVADAVAAMNAWSTVAGCSLQVVDGGTTGGCGLFLTDGENTISFNNCDGYFHGSGNCSSGILAVASIASYDTSQTRTVNGVSFYKALESNISFNPYSACNFGDHCNVQEITTHEMGHALGLHHSWDSSFGGSPTPAEQQATMYWVAHFDGRCASLRPDDINGITFIYPAAGGGGGPLTIVTSALAGGTVGSSYTQTLSATGGTLPYTWSLVAGLGTLPPGLNLSGAGVISGTPNTEGTYSFTVKVTDAAQATAQRALSIVVSASGGGGPLNSHFMSQSVPASLQPGQSFTANIKFLNTGTTTWSGVAYYYASQNPALNQTWGGNGVSLFGYAAGPGEVMDVTFTATAPTTPGAYNFQWQMYENGGAGFFGEMSTNVLIQVGSAPPHHADTIGLYNPAGGAFFLRNSNSGGVADISFAFGPAGAGFIPLVGDWNGDGVKSIGLYNPASGAFFLRNSNTAGIADISFNFGPAGLGFVPLVGDWNGDGVDTIGLYDPAHGGFFLRNSNSAGATDIMFSFGPAGMGFIPIVGDWNGDGVDTIGLYDPANAGFFLRNSNTSGGADIMFMYGPAGLGFKPVVGDWNADGTDTIGLYDPANSAFFLRNTNSSGIADVSFPYGPGGLGFMAILGDWDGL
ncbi:MAG TPA: putative Ig domain-containing protein [Blastocatellia bacterium]|nr:putative Ig domain-containing protein [Blastocatellia bacterium]